MDRDTRLHLEDARDQIARALDPKFATAAPAAPPGGIVILPGIDGGDAVSCFPDYAIRRSAF
jgi:hypothetical protein